MRGQLDLYDFGVCKIDMTSKDKTNTFCGTPEYLAPEVLKHIGYDMRVDWWRFGVLLYEMLADLPPFYDAEFSRPLSRLVIHPGEITDGDSIEKISEMYRKILNDPLKFPDEMGKDAQNLIARLLSRDPEDRLGSKGA
jgi:serum/glucocorticoid-regulated kinase 2